MEMVQQCSPTPVPRKNEHNIHSEYKIGNLAAGLITMSM